MKKVLLMGLIGIGNCGDEYIADCVQYILSQNKDISTKVVSLEPKMNVLKKLFYYFLVAISRVNIKNTFFQKIQYCAVVIRCHSCYIREIKSCGALIFSCGSFKYTTQKLWAYYALAVKTAEKYNKPVLFNGMNVQKYNPFDYRCRTIQQALCSPVVRMFTTRDGKFGVARLVNDYKIKPDLVCRPVGDPAFFISEKYKIKKHINTGVIGINLIKDDIFTLYGGHISCDKLLEVYVSLLHKLDDCGIEWELFTNGLKDDKKFGVAVLEKYGSNSKTIKTPSTPIDLLHIISSYDVVLCARLHACIAAYSMDIPFIGYYWDEKLVHFSEVSKTTDLFVSEDSFNTNELLKKLLVIRENGYKFDLSNKEYWKKEAQNCLEEFCEKI